MTHNFHTVYHAFFAKISWKQFHYIKVLKSWFDELFFFGERDCFFPLYRHNVEKRKFFSSNHFRVKFFSKKLISWNFCEIMVAVHSVEISEIFPHCTAKIFRQIDLQYNSLLVKMLIWRNFCKISWGKNLQISTLCSYAVIYTYGKVKEGIHFSTKITWNWKGINLTKITGNQKLEISHISFKFWQLLRKNCQNTWICYFSQSILLSK